jgi:hypothetical protein
MTKQNRAYRITLIVYIFLLVFCAAEYTLLMLNLSPDPGGRFVFEVLIFLTLLFLIDVVLILALLAYRTRNELTLTALNIVLLFWFPLGTVLGIYYLWKIRTNLNVPAS